MGILYGARYARFDLLRQTTKLAARISKWSNLNDRMLLELVRWVYSSRDIRQAGWLGDDQKELGLNFFCDADWAVCIRTQRSTSGIRVGVHRPHTICPLIGNSAAQKAVATSTPEAGLSAPQRLQNGHVTCFGLI